MTDSGEEQWRRFAAGDRLTADYPQVRALLAGLPPAALRRAGQALARLDPDAVLRAHPDTPVVTVATTGHGVLAGVVAPLVAQAARHGLLVRHVGTDFDSYVRELADPAGTVHATRPDLTLCVLDPTIVTDELPAPWRPADVAARLDAKVTLLAGLAERYAELGTGTLVYNTLPLPATLVAQLVDHRSRAELSAVWREANARLLRLTGPGLVVVDLDPLIAEGVPATDTRLSVYARAHLTDELLAAYARPVAHLARHLTGRTRKVLAVDLDGTLWGGILGDDGIDGIEVVGGRHGAAYQAFQKVVKQLGSQGVLVAAVSKNDPEPVRQVLREHPGMAVGEDDFVRVTANWRPKHDNLAELAGDLNLGVDSVVFVDDSPYETGLVGRELPDVAVVALDDEPAGHVAALLADGWFDVVEVTAEDGVRVARYRDELHRRDFLSSFSSLADYLRELGVAVRVAPPEEAEIGRLSQLTLRTNQFNFTQERLTPDRVRDLLDRPDTLVLAVRAADRFGDNGLVGAVFAHRDDDGVHIDNFLLSCRVFARGVEQAALWAVLRHARETGAAAVHGHYRRTAKNTKLRDFYPVHGFHTVREDGDRTDFRHDLSEIAPPPEHVRLTVTVKETA